MSIRFAIALVAVLCPVAFAAPPLEDDPKVIATLRSLGAHSAALLDPVRVQLPDGFTDSPNFESLRGHNMHKRGPGQRDYCNKAIYAHDRHTALYAGGNHQSPHRMNDVWEYHLGSNTWRMLYAPDGGNAGKHKAGYFLTSRTLARDPDAALTEKQRGQIEAYRAWWAEHVELTDGHIATKNGGPINPVHTWDGFCYDAAAKRMVWAMGVSPASQPTTHAQFTGRPLAEIEAEIDKRYTPMWTFDPIAKRWRHERVNEPDAPRPDLRGMGGTLAYLPDQQRTIWYVSAQNVSPQDHQMWSLDLTTNTWTDLKPNGGRSIRDLVHTDGVAPGSELQSAYDPKRKRLVAVLGHDTFVYDVATNAWSKATTDERIHAHDARSVFAYDPVSDTFLLAYPPDGRGKQLRLAALDGATLRWTLIEPNGPPIPAPKYGGTMGYFDPRLNVFVLQARYDDRMWVYRHARRP